MNLRPFGSSGLSLAERVATVTNALLRWFLGPRALGEVDRTVKNRKSQLEGAMADRRRTRTFTASDPDGNEYTLFEDTLYSTGGTLNGSVGELDLGRKDYRTADGRKVNWIAKGRYEIVGIKNIPLTSDAPDAP